MPNGLHGDTKNWERIESPLRAIDAALEDFAKSHALHVSKNYHNWPERSLTWGVDLKGLLQVYLADEATMTWHLWVCVSQDRGGERYWKNVFLRHGVPLPEIASNLGSLLAEGHRLASSWRAADLQFATTLGS